jgi:hypothetical protein
MNEIAISESAEPRIDLAAIESELRPLSSEKLRFRFVECYNGAAKLIAQAAVCVKLLKERGDSMTGIPMTGTYLRIASGQVLPELVWKFIESPHRQKVERLPIDDQRRLAANPVVPVVEPKPGKGNGYTTRMQDLTKATPEVAKIAIGPDGIRSPEEQLAFIGTQKARPILAKATSDDEPEAPAEPLRHQITVKLTASELEAIRIHAAYAHVSESEIVRRFLIRSGAFDAPKRRQAN